MGISDIILSRRTVRRFKPLTVERSLLEKLVNAGRLAPSAGNLQPLEFVAVDDAEVRREIFPPPRPALVKGHGQSCCSRSRCFRVVTLAPRLLLTSLGKT